MPSRARIPVVGLLMAVSLTGCILFPPWFFGETPPEPMPIVVENATDTNWVLSVEGDFPSAFAIGAGETGTIAPWGSATTELVLSDPECAEVHRLEWDGSAEGLRINDGRLEPLAETPEPSTAFAEFWDCVDGGFGSFGSPQSGTGLPDATGKVAILSEGFAPFLVDVSSAGIEPLEFGSGDPVAELDAEHSWSPDGSQVAFSRAAQGSSVYVADVATGKVELLSDDAGSPRWSPDGTRIAYLDLDPFAGGTTLMVRDMESGDTTELAPDASVPAWSPDGKRLAFLSAEETDSADDPPPSELRIVDADGSNLRTVAPASPLGPSPAWSPDGDRIAFSALPDGADPSAFGFETIAAVYDFGADDTTVVAAMDGASIGPPSWSPDGRTLAVAIQSVGFMSASGTLALVPAGGGELTELLEAANTYVTNPVWSPDGEWLAFVRVGETDFSGSLVAIRADGSEETVIATGVAEATAWLELPDGGR